MKLLFLNQIKGIDSTKQIHRNTFHSIQFHHKKNLPKDDFICAPCFHTNYSLSYLTHSHHTYKTFFIKILHENVAFSFALLRLSYEHTFIVFCLPLHIVHICYCDVRLCGTFIVTILFACIQYVLKRIYTELYDHLFRSY